MQTADHSSATRDRASVCAPSPCAIDRPWRGANAACCAIGPFTSAGRSE